MKATITIITMFVVLLASACGGSSFTPPDELPTHQTVYTNFGGAERIYGAPGLADPGTTAKVLEYNAQTLVEADGSFVIDFTRAASNAQTSTTFAPPLFIVSYSRDGRLVEEPVFDADYEMTTSVEQRLFSTGSGPNDMLYGNDSLYIANSMDNTVTRHSLDGELLATSQFNEFASPSYLGMGGVGESLLVTSNGENRLWQLDMNDLSGYLPSAPPKISENYAFIGPGQPFYFGGNFLVPYAMIETFSPTVYANTSIGVTPEFRAVVLPNIPLEGKNAQFAAVDSENQMYYVVSTGEIQFDEFWSPYADSDSFLTAFGHGDSPLNLGPIGAGRIAISPDGSTAFLGNSLSGNLYMVDLINMQVLRGESNPIVLTSDYTFISDVTFTPDGQYVLATSFNTDELYVVDAVTGEVNPGPYPAPFSLALDPELLAGAANVEITTDASRPGKYCAYVMFGVANTVAKVNLF